MSDKKKENLSAFRHILEMDKMISSREYPNVKKFMEKFEVSESTVNRNLAALRRDFGAEGILEYDREQKGFYYNRPSFRIPALLTSEKQIIAAKQISNLLNLIKGTPIYKDAIEVFTALSNNLDDDQKLNVKKLSNRILFLGMSPVQIEDEIWTLLEKAMCQNKYISFDYRDKAHRFVVQPWQLIYSNGMWTLYGYNPNEKSKDVRFYNLPEIHNLKIDKNTFELPADFEYNHRAKGNFRRYIGKETYNFKLRITSDKTLDYIRTYQWAEDQKFFKQEDGSTIMTFTSNQDYPVLGWVLSHGMYATPLEPEWLVNEWKRNVDGMKMQSEVNE